MRTLILLVILFMSIGQIRLSGQNTILLIQSSKQDTLKKGFPAIDKITEQSQIAEFMEEYVRLNESPEGEKIYLHLDRPNYIQGDTIWFKAYSWFGYDQIPNTINQVLYVNLISPEGRIKLSRKLLLQNGTSHGEFLIDTTINPGRYALQAYTRGMQNINSGEPFYRELTISRQNQNFEVECNPVIIKQVGNDSLKVSFRIFEIDKAGNLNNNLSNEANYNLMIGNRQLFSGRVQAANTKEQILKFSLANIKESDTAAVFGLSIRNDRLTFEKQFQIPLQQGIDLQFFPEGGKLVNGLENKVAFKAIGADGLSREIKGTIQTEDEKVVTDFESIHKGMGAFLLKPESNKNYFAHIWYNNRKYIIPLPTVSQTGCAMSVTFSEINNDPILVIRWSPSELNEQKYIVGSAYGTFWYYSTLKMMNDSCWLRIPVEQLPEGVCRLTVLNKDFKPEAERLVYIDKNQRFKIEVIPDSSTYATRSKINLLIRATGLDGEPVQTDLSVSVVDNEQITKDKNVSGISAYKLLKSELRGYIEDADYYFKDDSCTNRDALDLLLMTQGYRKFITGNTKADQLKFQPETSIDISGKITFRGSKSREKKFNYREIGLILFSYSQKPYTVKSNPDSLGQFRFKIPLMQGNSRTVLQASTPKKKPFYGDIFLDDPIPPPKFSTPIPSSNNFATPAIEYVRHLQAVRKTLVSQTPEDGLMSINIEEVVITAKAKNWYTNFTKDAIKIADLDSLDPTGKGYKNIYELLIKEFGAKEITLGLEITRGDGITKTILLPCVDSDTRELIPHYYFPIYVINGYAYFNGIEHRDSSRFYANLNLISSFPVNEIKKIMVLPPGEIANHYADKRDGIFIGQSLVVIETYSNRTYRGDPLGIKTFILDGLDVPREFYSPRYDGPARNSTIYDGRATLFWDPSLRTDTSGEAKIEFFTNDRQTSIEVRVNGIEVVSGNSGQKQVQINSTLKK